MPEVVPRSVGGHRDLAAQACRAPGI